jgi:hypothetical protein
MILVDNFDTYTLPSFDYYYLRDEHAGAQLQSSDLPAELLAADADDDTVQDARLVLQFSQLLQNHTRVWMLIRTDEHHSLQSRLLALMPTRYELQSQRIYVGEQVSIGVFLWVEKAPSGKGG